MVSKLEIIGEKLMERVLSRNQDYGGILGEITGAQGTGKTSVLLSITDRTITKQPEEKIFWREQVNAPIQIFKLGLDKINFMIPNNGKIVFRDRDKKLEHVELSPITYFEPKNYAQVYELAKKGKANLIFFTSPYEWMDFITYLREVGEWTNIFIDEMADIAPMGEPGRLYKRIGRFSGTMGAVRRCMMNLFYNSQTVSDVDWRIRKKVMFNIYLPGAISDKKSRVTQKAIDNLIRDPINGNDAFLDMSGEFGKIKFTDIYKPIQGYHIEAHVLPEAVNG